MRQIIRVVGEIIGFVLLAVLLALRIALAAVLAVITPIVMPVLALLSGGGLLVAIAFACSGHWYNAFKGAISCLICTTSFVALSAVIQILNPLAFKQPVTIYHQYRRK